MGRHWPAATSRGRGRGPRAGGGRRGVPGLPRVVGPQLPPARVRGGERARGSDHGRGGGRARRARGGAGGRGERSARGRGRGRAWRGPAARRRALGADPRPGRGADRLGALRRRPRTVHAPQARVPLRRPVLPRHQRHLPALHRGGERQRHRARLTAAVHGRARAGAPGGDRARGRGELRGLRRLHAAPGRRLPVLRRAQRRALRPARVVPGRCGPRARPSREVVACRAPRPGGPDGMERALPRAGRNGGARGQRRLSQDPGRARGRAQLRPDGGPARAGAPRGRARPWPARRRGPRAGATRCSPGPAGAARACARRRR